MGSGGINMWSKNGSALSGNGSWFAQANVKSFENVSLSSGADIIFGNSDDNIFFMSDLSLGVSDFDRVDGKAGNDTADFTSFGRPVWIDLGFSGVEAWTRGIDLDSSFSPWRQVANLDGIENLLGSRSDDKIFGDDDDNIIEGGQGNDIITGRAGADTFVFDFASRSALDGREDSFGDDTITDFEDGVDMFDLSLAVVDGDITGFSDITVSTNAAGDAVLEFMGGSVTLEGVDASLIDAGDFLF